MNEVLPMKKFLLLLSSTLLLVACNSSPADKYALDKIWTYKEVTYPEAKEITEEQAKDLAKGCIVHYDRWSSSSSIQRYDYTFHYENSELRLSSESNYPTQKIHSLTYKERGNIEVEFIEQNNDVRNDKIDTHLVHKQTNDYGNVMLVRKVDPDFRERYTLVYSEKYSAFSAGSMSVIIRSYADERLGLAYDTVSNYEQFFDFIQDDNFNHDVKYSSRGNDSVIMETTSKATGTSTLNGYRVSDVTYKMEFFENLLVGYEFTATTSSGTVIKKETVSLSYKRPEIELPSYWTVYLDD